MITSSKRLKGAFTERSEHGHFIVNHSINPRHDQGGVQCDGEVSSKSMATRKKYKIVLSEKYVRKSENGKEWFQFPVNISGQLVAIQTIIPLDPYTEPDLEQVGKEAYDNGYETAKHECEDCNANAVKIADDKAHEAYQKGYENGFIAGHLKAEKSGQSFYEDGYQRGLNDAWEAARKVVALSTVDRRKVFGSEYMYSILENHTASEAIEKIRQYKQEQEEIKVGDEVTAEEETSKFVVTWMNDRCICGVDEEGKCYSYEPREISGRTGRCFPEIAEVLQKMKES